MAFAQTEPPEFLQGGQRIPDADEIVARARKYDRLQSAMAEWDMALAREYFDADEKDLAEDHFVRAQERYTNIENVYRRILQQHEDHPLALTYLGEVLYDHTDEQSEALTHWHLAAKISDYSQPLNNLSLHYSHVGDYQRGLKYLNEALELEPDNPDYLYNKVQLYLIHWPAVEEIEDKKTKKVYEDAMEASKRTTELLPNDFEILQDYAVNFFAAERFGVEADWDEAAEAWQAAREQARTDDQVFFTWLNEARAWIERPNNEQARTCLQEALKIHPDSEAAKELLSRLGEAEAP
jgi:tetratricopeptide (TPR) repeat protein